MQVTMFEGNPLGVALPPKMDFEVVDTIEGAVKGNTATNVTKDATLETGMRSRCRCSSKSGAGAGFDAGWNLRGAGLRGAFPSYIEITRVNRCFRRLPNRRAL